MNFVEALELVRAFSAIKLRIFKQFSGFPDYCCQDSGYIVFADGSLLDELCYGKLKDFAEARNLRIEPFNTYLMIHGK